jgi:hypothetical protein
LLPGAQSAEFNDFKAANGAFTATLPAKSVVALEVEQAAKSPRPRPRKKT